ncbi:MAG: CsbD family protein [Pyrinomonadaceae bacterium]
MAIFNNDEVKGKWEQTKGAVKDKVGEVTGDSELEAEGEAQRAGGEAREGWGKVKRKVSDTIEDVADAVNR